MPELDIRPGDRVRIVGYENEGIFVGTVIENVPARGGCVVQPDNSKITGGFGYGELKPLPLDLRPTVWSRLLTDPDSF